MTEGLIEALSISKELVDTEIHKMLGEVELFLETENGWLWKQRRDDVPF